MIEDRILDGIRGKNVVIFVADEDELSPTDVPFPVICTGIGKMRMYDALAKWYGKGVEGNPVILNIGSAGSAKYPIGEILDCGSFINGGSDFIYDKIEISKEGCSVFSGDYFMSTQTFSPQLVKELSIKYDLFDMEAYAAALFCKSHSLPFLCFKAVSDNLDGSIKDWRSILSQIREGFTKLLGNL